MGVRVREKPKGSGVYWVFINHNGRRRSKKIGRDEDTANEVAEKINARLVLGEYDINEPTKNESPTLEKYALLWLEDYVKPLRKVSTHNRYKDVLKRYIFPTLGKRPIDQIRRGEIKALFLKLNKEGYARSMLSLIGNVISGLMNYAIDEELIESNPASGILRRLKLDAEKQLKVEPLTPEEINLFLSTCYNHFREHYEFFLCAFRTGMRLGEIIAIQWGDIDWNSKFIDVKRSYRRGRATSTKTGKTRRVDMSDQLTEALLSLRTKRKREGLRLGIGDPVNIVFHRNGSYAEQNYIRRNFKRVLSKAGLRNIRFHDIRHTYASLLLSQGESPVYVKEQLGHSSIQITVDIYGHLIPSCNRAAVNRLDSMHPNAPYTHPRKKEAL